MPSTRAQPLNPRAAPPPAGVRPASRLPAPAQPAPAQEEQALDERQRAARAGGFHESSFDLKLGLEVSESEWPEEVTIPAALGDR